MKSARDVLMQALGALATNYRQELSPEQSAVYVQVLGPYGADTVAAACMAILRDPDAPGWFPRTQEIVLRITGSRKAAATIAWSKFRTAIASHASHSVAFDDPLIHHVCQSLGGWSRLGQRDSRANDGLEDKFIALYGEAMASPPPLSEIPKILVNPDSPPGKAIPLGDRSRALSVMRGELTVTLGAIKFLPPAVAQESLT